MTKKFQGPSLAPPWKRYRILGLLRDFLRRRREAAAAGALSALSAIPVSERDPAQAVPIILPAELLDMGWPGPIELLDELPFALAWAFVGPKKGKSNFFVYVTHEQAEYWEARNRDWRALAFANLARLSEPYPASGEKLDDDGRPFIKVMLHEDAFGPSRLLLPNLFEDELGPDYLVAIPEQTCAVAWRNELTPEQQRDVDGMVDGCFEHGTEPMSPERFPASTFWSLAERIAR